jgi:hypothetical protein
MSDDELVPLNFKIPRSLKTRLQAYADRNHLSVTAAVRLLLPGALDRAERAEQRKESR